MTIKSKEERLLELRSELKSLANYAERIDQLSAEIEVLEMEIEDNEECPMCGSEMKLYYSQRINDCPSCGYCYDW